MKLWRKIHERAIEKRLRRLYQESFGDKNSFHCEVELTPDEIRIRGDHTQTVYEWKLVEEVVATHDSVDIFTRSGGVVVRNRAFQSLSDRDEFVALAQTYLAGGRSEGSDNESIRPNHT